jgi:Mg-chelatase subunit ChlD
MKLCFIRVCLLASAFSVALDATASGPPTALRVTEPLSLKDCSPVTTVPCFTLSISPVDEHGVPAGVRLPPQDRLLKAISVQTSSGALTPFYVKASTGAAAIARPNIVLIEMDISGSMNREVSPGVSRFAAARQAIAGYLATTQDGVDEVAIVPFESHHVVPTLQAAVFTSKQEQALMQLKALPDPGLKNNTALYQAVFTGVDVLGAELARLEKGGTSRANLTPQLIVMTDGKNEVFHGDDPALLDGPLGLEQSSAKVHAAGFDVVGIGFGNPSEIDTEALHQLSTRTFLASDPLQLAHAFQSSTPAHPSTLDVAFLSPGSDRQSLAAQNSQFTVALHLLDGRNLVSPQVEYLPPAMAMPLYSGHISYEALQALSTFEPPASSGWSTVLRGLLVFAGLGVVLLLLWFWVPRIIWRGDLDGLATKSAQHRWSKEPTVQASGVQVRSAPDGFGREASGEASQRTAAQITQVRLRTDLSSAASTERR